jgi:asparagine synthase (glutamine-hydrolysing)
MAHRGPDGSGYAVMNRGGLGLGHVRLAVRDLEGGDQPIYNEDGSVAVVANGEFYDYEEQRRELEGLGHHFRARSDTELVVHLYEEWGASGFKRLRGEFAFVLWDERRGELLAAKDPVGVKPLYYRLSAAEVLIASEVKGILALERVERAFSPRYLTGPLLGVYPSDPSVFAGVSSLKPGHYLRVDRKGKIEERAYGGTVNEVDARLSFSDTLECVRQHLTRAVRRRLVADVPVHCYLSGGIDSAIVCALMAREGRRVTAYNVAFPDSPFDESPKARAVAAHLGASFETLACSDALLAEHLTKTVYHLEMPLFNPNSVAKQLLSGFVRSFGQRVCLTGEGGDEVFAGYPYFKLEAIWRLMLQGGESRRRAQILWRRFREMEARSEGLLWDKRVRWQDTEGLYGYPSYIHVRAVEARSWIPRLYQVERLGITAEHDPEVVFRESFPPEKLRGLHPLNVTRLMSMNQLHGAVIPALGDRVEMANAVECRTPFLDTDLLDFSWTIPSEYFIDIERLREKRILHEAYKDILPGNVREDHKHPFLAPPWARFADTKPGRQLFEEFLSREAIARAGIYRPELIAWARWLWRWHPARSVRRRLDVLLGIVVSMHILHRLFIENRVSSDSEFPLVDRSSGHFSNLTASKPSFR